MNASCEFVVNRAENALVIPSEAIKEDEQGQTTGTAGWTASIAPQAIVLAFGFSAAVGVFFGSYPAHKASRLNPIEALRYEGSRCGAARQTACSVGSRVARAGSAGECAGRAGAWRGGGSGAIGKEVG